MRKLTVSIEIDGPKSTVTIHRNDELFHKSESWGYTTNDQAMFHSIVDAKQYLTILAKESLEKINPSTALLRKLHTYIASRYSDQPDYIKQVLEEVKGHLMNVSHTENLINRD